MTVRRSGDSGFRRNGAFLGISGKSGKSGKSGEKPAENAAAVNLKNSFPRSGVGMPIGGVHAAFYRPPSGISPAFGILAA